SSKHAIAGVSQTLALELATTGVNVNCICPGPVDTEMMRDIEQKALGDAVKTEDAIKQFAAGTPNGRYAKAEEVAALSVFMASPLVSHITGDLINIDGGVAATGR
ncbi:MAG: SDR family oxidoreductase, partial [Lachnospiraceae bacterium]|nr:SDR family oxidoreductase [Lachnospiraceae bacterium]